jgi:hypothetical protein
MGRGLLLEKMHVNAMRESVGARTGTELALHQGAPTRLGIKSAPHHGMAAASMNVSASG